MIAVTGLVLEALVAVLLMVTIVYCIILDRRIRSFKAEQINLAGLVTQLSSATTNAEVAVAGLKTTAEEADDELDGKLKKARSLSEELAFMVETGTNLAGKLADPDRRGHSVRHEQDANNVAYLKTGSKSQAHTGRMEPAFANPVRKPEVNEAEPIQGNTLQDRNQMMGEHRRVRPAPVNTTPQPDLPREQPYQAQMQADLPRDGTSQAKQSMAKPQPETRQTLAQALRYAR